MKKPALILILSLEAGVDRSEFEPDAKWRELGGRLMVSQEVNKEGGYLVGATGTFREHLSDEILSDLDRFAGLLPNG